MEAKTTWKRIFVLFVIIAVFGVVTPIFGRDGFFIELDGNYTPQYDSIDGPMFANFGFEGALGGIWKNGIDLSLASGIHAHKDKEGESAVYGNLIPVLLKLGYAFPLDILTLRAEIYGGTMFLLGTQYLGADGYPSIMGYYTKTKKDVFDIDLDFGAGLYLMWTFAGDHVSLFSGANYSFLVDLERKELSAMFPQIKIGAIFRPGKQHDTAMGAQDRVAAAPAAVPARATQAAQPAPQAAPPAPPAQAAQPARTAQAAPSAPAQTAQAAPPAQAVAAAQTAQAAQTTQASRAAQAAQEKREAELAAELTKLREDLENQRKELAVLQKRVDEKPPEPVAPAQADNKNTKTAAAPAAAAKPAATAAPAPAAPVFVNPSAGPIATDKLVVGENFWTIYFLDDQTVMMASSTKMLDTIGEMLKANPKATVTVRGYSYAKGSEASQERMAELRARYCADYFQKNYGVKTDRVKVDWGKAGSAPVLAITTNATTYRAAEIYLEK